MFGRVLPDDTDSDVDVGQDSDDSEEEKQEFTDYNNVKYHDYKYCITKSDHTFLNEEEDQSMALRKASFIMNEVLADMGFAKKSSSIYWVLTIIFAAIMMRVTVFMHHLG